MGFSKAGADIVRYSCGDRHAVWEWCRLKVKETELITLEEALASTRAQSVDRFTKHVNPVEARLFRLLDSDKRYKKAEGIRISDDRGEEYLDFTAGYGSLCLGHNPAEVLTAVNQAADLPTVSSFFLGTNPLVGALAEDLQRLLPGQPEVACFGNGGAEAVEMALKTARSFTGKKRLIYADGSYHGQTFGTLSISGQAYKRHFEPLLPNCENVPFGDLQALESKLSQGDVAAFIVEPVQAEGGCNIPQKGYLPGAKELCNKYGALLILDEIQTGFGRTGKMFAAEHDLARPDIFVLSKALGAGVMPISASVTSSEIWREAYSKENIWESLISTFGGNPRACAAAIKTIEILVRDSLVAHAREMGEYALRRLRDLKARHKTINEVRGIGLLLGIEFSSENISNFILSRMLNKHRVIMGNFDHRQDMLRLQPPLIVQKEEIDHVLEALDEACGKSSIGLALGAGKTAIGRALRPPK
jgi:putrescine aminotransferase